jgi:hypothetical protein
LQVLVKHNKVSSETEAIVKAFISENQTKDPTAAASAAVKPPPAPVAAKPKR